MKRLILLFLCLPFFVLPVNAQSGKYVALTFDDGPSGRYTRTLLDGLSRRGVKATFFLCGYRMKEYPALTRRIHEEGHEIGLHGYSHSSMKEMDQHTLERELNDSLALLPAGCRPLFMRPPGGESSQAVGRVARQMDLGILSWSVDPRDWATDDAAAITASVTASVRSGDVILLHDMSESSVEAALSIIDSLKKQGFSFVTAKELARLKGYSIEPGKIYRSF